MQHFGRCGATFANIRQPLPMGRIAFTEVVETPPPQPEKVVERPRVSREEYLAKSLRRTRPWAALGISERTWYRMRREAAKCPSLRTRAPKRSLPAFASICPTSRVRLDTFQSAEFM